MKRYYFLPVFFAAAFLSRPPACFPNVSDGGKFAWVQLDVGGACDTYPSAYRYVLKFVEDTTSIDVTYERRMLKPEDPLLFESAFLTLACGSAPDAISEEGMQRIRSFLSAGGTLWIENTSGQKYNPFDGWVRDFAGRLFPDSQLEPLRYDHPVFRSFFLIRSVAGRTSAGASLEGLQRGGRTVIIYSRNDLLGPWLNDALGKPLYACFPGGEPQRMNAKMLSLNIIMYILTGTYKLDAVHQPFILQKLRLRDSQ